MWTLSVIFWIIFVLVVRRILELGIVFVVEYTSYGDHIPTQKPSVPLALDFSDVDKQKLAALEAAETVSPSKVVLNGHANGKLVMENEKSGVHGQNHKKDEKEKEKSLLLNSGRLKSD